MPDHPANHRHIDVLKELIHPIEAPVEEVLPSRGRSQPQGALRGLQRHGVNRTDQRRGRDRQRKLPVELPVIPPRNALGKNTAISTSVMPMMGPSTSSIARIVASLGGSPFSM